MKIGFSSFRLGIAELAILGLLFPAECDDLPEWSGDERNIFRRAAVQVLKNGENIEVRPNSDADALTEANWQTNARDYGWWPAVVVSGSLDHAEADPQEIHDLTVPVIWGAEWLLDQMVNQEFLTSNSAVQKITLLIDRANDRLEALQVLHREGGISDEIPSLKDACEDLSIALAETGPVFMYWPPVEPEPA